MEIKMAIPPMLSALFITALLTACATQPPEQPLKQPTGAAGECSALSSARAANQCPQ